MIHNKSPNTNSGTLTGPDIAKQLCEYFDQCKVAIPLNTTNKFHHYYSLALWQTSYSAYSGYAYQHAYIQPQMCGLYKRVNNGDIRRSIRYHFSKAVDGIQTDARTCIDYARFLCVHETDWFDPVQHYLKRAISLAPK